MLIFIFNIHLSQLTKKYKRLKTHASGHLVLRINREIIIRSDIVITFYIRLYVTPVDQ